MEYTKYLEFKYRRALKRKDGYSEIRKTMYFIQNLYYWDNVKDAIECFKFAKKIEQDLYDRHLLLFKVLEENFKDVQKIDKHTESGRLQKALWHLLELFNEMHPNIIKI